MYDNQMEMSMVNEYLGIINENIQLINY